MFSIFQKKEPNQQAMAKFWDWFLENEAWICTNSNANTRQVSVPQFIAEIDQRLTPCFPYFPAQKIEFQLGFNNGKGEFFFYDLKNKNLNRDGQLLADKMPEALRERWTFILEH